MARIVKVVDVPKLHVPIDCTKRNVTRREIAMFKARFISVLIALSFSETGYSGESLQAPDSAIRVASIGRKVVSKFQNGFLIDSDVADSGLSQIYIYSRTGAEVMHLKMAIPGALRADVYDFAVSPGGVFAVSGVAFTSDGAYAGYIAWIGSDGSIQRVVRTNPFGAFRLAFSGDGNLWASGKVQKPDQTEESVYDIIRRFDAEGRLIGSSLPRSSFAIPLNKRNPAANAFLMQLGDGIAFYNPWPREWIQLTSSGSVSLRTIAMDAGVFGSAEAVGKIRVTGAAALNSGRVYISAVQPDASGKDQPTICRVDPSTSNWQTVDASRVLSSGQHGSIVGADGEDLVIANGTQLWWAKVQ